MPSNRGSGRRPPRRIESGPRSARPRSSACWRWRAVCGRSARDGCLSSARLGSGARRVVDLSCSAPGFRGAIAGKVVLARWSSAGGGLLGPASRRRRAKPSRAVRRAGRATCPEPRRKQHQPLGRHSGWGWLEQPSRSSQSLVVAWLLGSTVTIFGRVGARQCVVGYVIYRDW